MDLRVLFNYFSRWIWLWILLTGVTAVAGFAPTQEISFMLAMPLIYLVIPMSSEFRKQGPMWVHRTLPIQAEHLARTAWLLAVVMPVAAVALSLLPAAVFGLIAHQSNLARMNLLPLMGGGVLWTSVTFTLMVLGNGSQPSKLANVLLMGGSFLIAGGFILLLMKSSQYWGHAPFRVGLILGAGSMLPVSYLISPRILQAMGRNVGEAEKSVPGEIQAMYAECIWDRIMAVPFWRTLVTGVWLLAFLFWMNLFYALLAGRTQWFDIKSVFAMAPVGMQMVAMFLFLYSFAYVTNLRGMATLPISRIRRTLTVISLPLAGAIPFTLFVLAQLVYMGATPAEMTQFAIGLLFCLITAYGCLCICLRFGFMPAVVGLVGFMVLFQIRVLMAGSFGMPELGGWDGLAGVGMILVAGLWIHDVLDRCPDVYRRHWIPVGLRRW